MTILYFYQYFATPKGSWGTRVYEFAKRWAKKGDKVIVVTSIYDKSDLKSSGISSRQIIDGVEVRVLNIRLSNKHHILRRLWSFAAYSILSIYYALVTKCDLVVASSGPITVGIPGLAARYLRGRKLVFEVRDLWPEGAIQTGHLKKKWAQKLAYWLERKCYMAATRIVAFSPGMAGDIIKRYGLTNVDSVTNASDIELFSRDTSGFALPDWAQGKKMFLYTGNIGQTNNSWWIVKAAELVADSNPEILFVFIGDGQQRKEIAEYIEKKQLKNIRIVGLMPKNELVAWVQRAYFMLVAFDNKPVLDTSSPNKMFDSMAAGIPVIQSTQGWIKELLVECGCGYTAHPDRPEELARICHEVVKDPAKRDEMGIKARKLAEEQFDRNKLSEKMHRILLEVHNSSKL